MRRTRYRQAKSKPQWKAWSMYGDVCRRDVLEAALRQVVANGGAPGVDGVKVKDLVQDAERREQWLTTLENDLRGKTYRLKSREQQAVAAIEVVLLQGRRDVVDVDLSGYFDTIPHTLLMRLIKGRVSDGAILRLIKGSWTSRKTGWSSSGSGCHGGDPGQASATRTVNPVPKAAANCGRRSGRKPPGALSGSNPKKSSPASTSG